MSRTMVISRATVLGCAQHCGLGGVLALVAVALNSRGGSTPASMGRLSKTMCLDRHTMKDYVASAADAGYLRESGTRNRKWRWLAQDEGATITFPADVIEQHTHLGDALALAVLMMSLATENDDFVIDFDTLAELAACSRDTLDRKFATLEKAGFAERQRVSRSEYRVRINVPSGTPATFANVRRANPIADLRQKALAILRARLT
jgi:DNA-binding MarR family transcriptional regulator